MIPIRTTEQLHQQGGQLLMQCYEQENGINCYGNVPSHTLGLDYLRAKGKALKIALKYDDLPLYSYIKSNL